MVVAIRPRVAVSGLGLGLEAIAEVSVRRVVAVNLK